MLVVGAGGLGSPAALYLTAAGVGTLGLVDFDVVDPSNLQRQVLHGTGGVGKSKLDSARARLADLNPHVRLETFDTRLTSVVGSPGGAADSRELSAADLQVARARTPDLLLLDVREPFEWDIMRIEGGVTSRWESSRHACASLTATLCRRGDSNPHGLAPTGS